MTAKIFKQRTKLSVWSVITVYKLHVSTGGVWKGIWKNRVEVSRQEIMGDCFLM